MTVLSPTLASSFEKNPKPKLEDCPELLGLVAGGDELPMDFHMDPPLPGPLDSEAGGASSFLSLVGLGLLSNSIHFPPDAFSMSAPSDAGLCFFTWFSTSLSFTSLPPGLLLVLRRRDEDLDREELLECLERRDLPDDDWSE